MARTIEILVLAVGLLTLPACQAVPPPRPEPHGLATGATPSARLMPTDLTAIPSGDGLLVAGKVAKRYPYRGRILGHVDLELLDAEGRALSRQSVALSTYSPCRNNPDYAGFNRRIAPLPAGTTSVRVTHVPPTWD